MALEFLVRENKLQASVKAATADINKEAAKAAENRVKAQQNNNGARKAILNDIEFAGPNVTITKGSNMVANVENPEELRIGAKVTGPGIPADAKIASISGTSVTLTTKAQTSMAAAKVRSAEIVERVTFSPWEALVQAIMFSNEAAYVN
jgi:hypothetical protein